MTAMIVDVQGLRHHQRRDPGAGSAKGLLLLRLTATTGPRRHTMETAAVEATTLSMMPM